MRIAQMNPERSSPFAILAPTLMLAEKNVNPSMMTNIDQKPLRSFALEGTASSE